MICFFEKNILKVRGKNSFLVQVQHECQQILKTVGSAAVAGGVAGAKHSVMSGLQGTFTWAEWGTEVGVAAAISAFTVAPTYFAGYATATCGFRDY